MFKIKKYLMATGAIGMSALPIATTIGCGESTNEKQINVNLQREIDKFTKEFFAPNTPADLLAAFKDGGGVSKAGDEITESKWFKIFTHGSTNPTPFPYPILLLSGFQYGNVEKGVHAEFKLGEDLPATLAKNTAINIKITLNKTNATAINNTTTLNIYANDSDKFTDAEPEKKKVDSDLAAATPYVYNSTKTENELYGVIDKLNWGDLVDITDLGITIPKTGESFTAGYNIEHNKIMYTPDSASGHEWIFGFKIVKDDETLLNNNNGFVVVKPKS